MKISKHEYEVIFKKENITYYNKLIPTTLWLLTKYKLKTRLDVKSSHNNFENNDFFI